jgi:hypothetical protein
MAHDVHPDVRAIHHVARSIAQHGEAPKATSWWRGWFPRRQDRLYDKVRAFGHVLKRLLDLPPTMLTAEDIAAIGADVEQVVRRAEAEIERRDHSSREPINAFALEIYTVRLRYEQIYKRGAS